MSKITNGGLTQSGTAVTIWQLWASNGYTACRNRSTFL